MRHLDNTINNSGNYNNFLHNFLHYLDSWNFDYAVYNLLCENFHNFGYDPVDVNWDWLRNIHRDMLDITNNDWFLYDKFDWGEVLNENWNLPIMYNQFFLYSSQGHNLFNYHSFFLDDLFENWDLRMAWNFDYFLFDWSLHEMALLDNNFFWILFIYKLFHFYHYSFRFLAVTMLGIIDWLLDHYFHNFREFVSFDDCLLFLHELNFFLSDNVMNGAIDNLILLLLVDLRHCLLHFKHSIHFFVDIFRHLLFHFDLFDFHHFDRIWNLDLFMEFLSFKHSLCKINWDFSDEFNVFFFSHGDFHKVDSFNLLNHFLGYPGWHWDQLLDSGGHLQYLCFTVNIRNFLSVWDSLLQVDCEMIFISYNHCFLLPEWYS